MPEMVPLRYEDGRGKVERGDVVYSRIDESTIGTGSGIYTTSIYREQILRSWRVNLLGCFNLAYIIFAISLLGSGQVGYFATCLVVNALLIVLLAIGLGYDTWRFHRYDLPPTFDTIVFGLLYWVSFLILSLALLISAAVTLHSGDPTAHTPCVLAIIYSTIHLFITVATGIVFCACRRIILNMLGSSTATTY